MTEKPKFTKADPDAFRILLDILADSKQISEPLSGDLKALRNAVRELDDDHGAEQTAQDQASRQRNEAQTRAAHSRIADYLIANSIVRESRRGKT